MKTYVNSVKQYLTQTNFIVLCVIALVVLISLNIGYTISAHKSINEMNTFLLGSIYATSKESFQIIIHPHDTYLYIKHTFTIPKGYCMKTLNWVSAIYNTHNPNQEQVRFAIRDKSDASLVALTSIFSGTPPTLIDGKDSISIPPTDGPKSVCAFSEDRTAVFLLASSISDVGNAFSMVVLDFEIIFQALYDYA